MIKLAYSIVLSFDLKLKEPVLITFLEVTYCAIQYFLMGILYSKICSIMLYIFLRIRIRLFNIRSFRFKYEKYYLS